MDIAVPILIVVVAVWIIIYPLWSVAHGEKAVRKWAEMSGYTVLEVSHRWFMCGPFIWWKSRSQEVYRIAVQDETGRTRHGFARVGSFFWPTDDVEVRWD